jgi:Domain of unknown function (DUF4158)
LHSSACAVSSRCIQRARHAAQLGHDQNVAGADVLHELIPAWPIHAGAGDLVGEDLLAPRRLQGVDLRIKILTDAADAGVSDAMQLMCVDSAESYQVPAESALCFSQRFPHGIRASRYDKRDLKCCRAESVLFALAESRSRMASESRRLSILTAQEVDDLYDLPRFSRDDRDLYFDLSPAERELVDGVFTLSVEIHLVLQLGYFKAKRQFFVYALDAVTEDAGSKNPPRSCRNTCGMPFFMKFRGPQGLGNRPHSSALFPGERPGGNQVARQVDPA